MASPFSLSIENYFDLVFSTPVCHQTVNDLVIILMKIIVSSRFINTFPII